MSRRVISAGLALAIVLVASACSNDSSRTPISPGPSGTANISDIASAAAAPEAEGVRRDGTAPPSNGGPRITVTGNSTVINGGTLAVMINADAPFNTVYIFIGGRTLGLLGEFGGGIAGHYQISLPSNQTSANVVLALHQQLPVDQFDVQFAVANSSGAVGPYVTQSAQVTRVGTGDVQVTLSWNTDADVDLHVVAPGNDEIYYARRQSPSGGELDLDSNAGCSTDGVRNENITWPVGRAPRGQYTVRVDYWSSCGATRTDYSVLVNNGGSAQLVSGFFTGDGDRGGAGSGRTVATFERTSGPSPIVSEAPLTDSAALFFKKLVTPQPQRR